MSNTIIIIMITVLGIISVIHYKREENLANPISIFNTVWAFIFYYSWSNKYVTPGHINTYYLMFFAIIFFDLGCISVKYIKKRSIKIGNRKVDFFSGDYQVRYHIVYILMALSTVYYLINFLFVLKNIGSFSLANIMLSVTSDDYLVKNSKIINVFYTLIVNPFSFIASAITAVDYVVGHKNRKLLWGTMIMLGFRLFSSGNRLSFLMVFIFLFFMAELNSHKSIRGLQGIIKRKDKKRLRLIIMVSLFTFLVLFVYTSISRGYNVLQNLTINFAIPVRMFEIWTEKVNVMGVHGYGEASIQGFIYPIFYILKNSIGLPMPSIVFDNFNIIESTVIEWVNAGYYMHNAYVSIFWYFYYDFGTVGVILFSFFWGRISFIIYKIVESKRNCKVLAFYCIIISSLLMSYGNFIFANISTGVGAIMLLFFIYKRKEQINQC